jgi:ubiquinone/menaquinone biosynthesis C-methylase UbiE
MGSDSVASDVAAGQAVYNRFVLSVYDLVVLRLSSRLVWRCPKSAMLANYQRNVGARHLDLGVGTAYFLDNVVFPSPRPDITLADLNPTVLQTAFRRISRYEPATVRTDVLQPLPFTAASFDSIGMNFLLHCLPGTWRAKGAVLASAARLRRPGGRVFGSTILGAGAPITPAARRLMTVYNRRGIFHNSTDDLAGLRAGLDDHFPSHRITLRGCVALFEAGDAGGDS